MASADAQVGDRYDVVVVGGGPAGLSGAKALARARRSVLVLDAGEPRNASADGVHNYLGHEGAAPADLLAAGRAEVTAYGGQVLAATARTARRVTGPLHEPDGGFVVELSDGRAVRSRRLLVAAGVVDELPPVRGVAERWGRDVLHCPYCHGWEVRDRAIGILATAPMAIAQALMWRQLSDDVTVFLHTAAEPTAEQSEQLDARGISVLRGEVTGLEITGDRLTGVRMAGGRIVARDALVVTPRLTARSALLESLGLRPSDLRMGDHVLGSRIEADPTGATAVPGVWVAGNVADPLAQVMGAAAAGMAAGAAVNADLLAEDTAQAVARARAPRDTPGRSVDGQLDVRPLLSPGRT